MNADTISCPYCNSQFAAPAASVGSRLSCPRCGESFPYRASTALQSEPGPSTVLQTAPSSSRPTAALALAPPTAERWSNRRLAFSVLTVMTGMALVGLTFALLTIQGRRDHDVKPPPPPPPPLLAYLPSGSNIVLNMNVTEAMRTPTGRAFLDHAEIGNLGFRFEAIEKAVGLNRDNLDQVALVVRSDELQIVVLVRTRRPYNAQQVRDALKADTPVKIDAKTAYRFEVPGLGWSSVVWPANDRTLVVASSTHALKTVPDAPDVNGVPSILETLRKDHLAPGAQVWLTASLDNLETLRPFLQTRLSRGTLDALLGVRSLAIGLHLDDAVKLDAVFQSKDEASAEALQKLFQQTQDTAYLKVLGPQAGGEKVAAALAKSLSSKRDGTRVRLEAQADAETVQQALKP